MFLSSLIKVDSYSDDPKEQLQQSCTALTAKSIPPFDAWYKDDNTVVQGNDAVLDATDDGSAELSITIEVDSALRDLIQTGLISRSSVFL